MPTMLVVEVDGDTHAQQEAYDARRTTEMEERGYRVMRFTNGEVAANLDGVLMAIAAALEELPLSPTLSPEGERE
jgi:very-short-patch-repair endonuclease